MADALRFFIIDGYPRESREQFDTVGMKQAGFLYRDLARKYVPDAECDIWFSSDPGKETPPADEELAKYDAVLWPGCNLTIYDDDPRVKRHLALVDQAYSLGIPQFGSCWGIQLAVAVAGGEIVSHPDGREMGVARYLHLTDAGKTHPMFEGKPPSFCHLVSHDDHIVKLPDCATLLAGNYHSPVQAVAVEYKKGVFWATQYHPEYDLHEMAALILAREEKLLRQGLFQDVDALKHYAEQIDLLFGNPDRKDLRWQYAIGDDILNDDLRTCEFGNWIKHVVIPHAGRG